MRSASIPTASRPGSLHRFGGAGWSASGDAPRRSRCGGSRSRRSRQATPHAATASHVPVVAGAGSGYPAAR